jgi:hypothetical protein
MALLRLEVTSDGVARTDILAVQTTEERRMIER